MVLRRWGIFYDTQSPNVYLETFLVDSWAEHQRQHERFTVADRELEKRVLSYALEPTTGKALHLPRRDEVVLTGSDASQTARKRRRDPSRL